MSFDRAHAGLVLHMLPSGRFVGGIDIILLHPVLLLLCILGGMIGKYNHATTAAAAVVYPRPYLIGEYHHATTATAVHPILCVDLTSPSW